MLNVNGKDYEYKAGESLYALLHRASFNPDFVACEVNEVLVIRDDYKTYKLADESKVEVFSFVGGG